MNRATKTYKVTRSEAERRGTGTGDLYIELAVETPVNLSARQRDLLKEFEAAGRDNSPENSGLLLEGAGVLGGDERLTVRPMRGMVVPERGDAR